MTLVIEQHFRKETVTSFFFAHFSITEQKKNVFEREKSEAKKNSQHNSNIKSDELFLYLTAAILAKCVVTMQNIALPCLAWHLSSFFFVSWVDDPPHLLRVYVWWNMCKWWHTVREGESMDENRSLEINGLYVGVLWKRTINHICNVLSLF